MKNSSEILNNKLIKPAPYSLKTLSLFWFLVFIIPSLTSKFLATEYLRQQADKMRQTISIELKTNIESFLSDLSLENFLKQKIVEEESKIVNKLDFSLPANSKNLSILCDEYFSGFRKENKFTPTFIMAASIDGKESATKTIPEAEISPGRKSSQIILEFLANAERKNISAGKKKLFAQLSHSLLGDYLRFPEQPGNLSSGFLAKNTGEKVFLYYNFIASSVDKKPLGIYLVGFSESRIGIKRVLQAALANAKPGFHRSYSMKRTKAGIGIVSQGENLSLWATIPPETLRIGSHNFSSWYDYALKNGIARKKPAKLPQAIVDYNIENHLKIFRLNNQVLNFSLLIVNFFGLVLLKQLLGMQKLPFMLQQKFFLAILFSILLPLMAFFILSKFFLSFYSELKEKNLIRKIQQNQKIIELNIQNNDSQNIKQINQFVGKLKSMVNQPEKEILQLLNGEFGKLFDGFIFFRNDGLLLERFPESIEISNEDMSKLRLFRDLTCAQAYNIFSKADLLTENFYENAKKLKDFVRWKALSIHFEEMDSSSFCQQDGDFYPTERADKGYFRVGTYNIFPENKSSFWGHFVPIQNARRIADEFLSRRAGEMLFSNLKNQASLTHTAIFLTTNIDLAELDYTKAWPKSALKDKEMLKATSRIDSVHQEAQWSELKSEEKVIYCARAVAGLPMIIVSRTEMFDDALNTSIFHVFYLLLLVYSIFLVSILGNALSQAFVKPIKILLSAVGILNKNKYPEIQTDSKNELGNLLLEFNSMAEDMRQRKLLDRFVSKEASDSVSAISQQEIGSRVSRAIIFFHIRKFNDLIESISPEAAISLLNHYFSHMEKVIDKNGGIIDKYIGDAIMASFSFEKAGSDIELNACNAAIDAKDAINEVNKKLKLENLPQILIGTGISFGNAILGEIGAKEGRRDFTLIGDTVNLAARLESMSHFSPTQHILISDSVNSSITKKMITRKHGKMPVKGKSEPVDIFELIGRRNEK